MTVSKPSVIHLLLVCVAICFASGQSTEPVAGPLIIAFKWISRPSPYDQEAMNTLTRNSGWIIDNNPLSDQKGIVIIESRDRPQPATVKSFAAHIMGSFPHQLIRLEVDSENSETRVFTGNVIVFLAAGTNVGVWSRKAVKKGLTVTQDPDIHDSLRVLVSKPDSTLLELREMLAKMPNVQQSEPEAILLESPGVNRMSGTSEFSRTGLPRNIWYLP
jgi:hypothetical protein